MTASVATVAIAGMIKAIQWGRRSKISSSPSTSNRVGNATAGT